MNETSIGRDIGMKINRSNAIFYFLLVLHSIMGNLLSSLSTEKQQAKCASLVSTLRDHGAKRSLKHPVMLITIPKSGTHLVEKCLYLMDNKTLSYNYNEKFNFPYRWKKNKEKDHVPPNYWRGDLHPSVIQRVVLGIKRSYSDRKTAYKDHLYYDEGYDNFLDGKNFKKILLLRDPRAVIVSFANMVKDGFESDHKIDFEDLLLDLIDGRQKNYISWASSRHTAYPFIWEVGICNFYKMYLPFIRSKNCLTIRFENLVGVNGGGTYVRQVHEIKQLAHHIGIVLGDNKVAEIMSNLFGNSATFHQGTIDGWKKYFTPVVKAAFKNVAGANALLIALGYERDVNW